MLKSLPAGAAFAVGGCGVVQEKGKTIDIDFKHGVASGDPLSDRLIIWTRVSPVELLYTGAVEVEWEISKEDDFNVIFTSGSFVTDADRDFTVKVDAKGLSKGQNYFYRFLVGDKVSVVGEAKTLQDNGTEPVNLAIVSCSNYPWGFFNGYRAIAENGPFDAVIHLGDYIYEYEVEVSVT